MKAGRYFKLKILFLFAPLFPVCQNRTFEIFGTITGTFNSKIYLFFDGNYRQRDSISSEIKNGKFYFKGTVSLPVLARLHMDQRSFIGDFYMDNTQTHVKCATKMQINNPGPDTLNMLTIKEVKGSFTDNLRQAFETRAEKIRESKLSDEEKREAYYRHLLRFISNHPKSKISPYLLGKTIDLRFSQVKQLSSFIDSSLEKTFEMKTVTRLLIQSDKSKYSATGMPFKDVVLNDSIGNVIDTKQFRGKYVLIVCWASWCKPCRAEHPELNDLYKKYKDRGFEIIGISLDKDATKWKQAIIGDQLHWPQLIDPNAFEGELAEYYGIEAIPASFFIDKEGKIVSTGMTPGEIEAAIIKLL